MSASEFRISYQQVSSSQPAENIGQFKICRCGVGDPNFQIKNTSETGGISPTTCPNCQILKSGNLLLSSKGIGWTVWKKRWFILTRTSLVFFRSDPNAPPPRGSEPVVTLGGIDLNNTGSIIVKEERKLLTVVFPDGRDGRTFTLKQAETTEDLNEWRSALENALAQAPSAVNTAGQHPIVRTDATEPVEVAVELCKLCLLFSEVATEDNSVIGRPAEFALVDADGSPSFLEKALKFIEDYGVKVEGILRQSADVEEVKRRVRDYEQGKNEFSPEEDAHVIGDCIKYVLREMPSSPVPATCCTALVRAYRTDKTRRLDAMNRVIYEVFPEPNQQLLQRILKMMQIVGSHKAVNRMSQSALAACMAPLLLRPLLLGECEIDSDFSMAGDGSFQLLQAAAAANHAQAIVIIMLEEYDQIFDDIEDGSYSSDAYTESDSGDIDKEYSTDNGIPEEDGSYDSKDDIAEDLDDNTDEKVNNNISGTACNDNDKAVQPPVRAVRTEHGVSREGSSKISSLLQVDDTSQMESNSPSQSKQESCESNGSTDHIRKPNAHSSSSSRAKFMEKTSSSSNESTRTLWSHTSARKDMSTETACYSDDEAHIENLENNKSQLHSKITKEVKENAILQGSLERRKEALHERRLALEKEVENLRDQLQKERNLRASLESGLMNMRRGQVSFPSTIDSKTKADLEEVATAEADIMNLKQKVSDLRGQLNNQVQLSSTSLCESCNKRILNTDKLAKDEQNAALSPEVNSSVETPPIVGPNSVPGMVSTTDMADIEQPSKQATHNSPSSTDKPDHQKQQLSTNYKCNTSSGVTSTEQAGTINQRAQKVLPSKGEVAKDSQDGSTISRWNFAQRQYSNSPLIGRLQGSSAYSSTKTEESGSAPSALAKLTSRLNFLKERRALLASEMQNLDLARPQGPTAPPKRDSR
ncbi:rho GTPase-activating protein REN1-like isoform X3 [Phragmites australis]|uniref:rho GTPase-activating protein REN1-like isoform X3 n=1 Tax=Phragmites australis TaxID=29695 RepID=UPI002D797455|nr:rho GTPase-activating protein REN1-like isoform X3 [Phragmites australis]